MIVLSLPLALALSMLALGELGTVEDGGTRRCARDDVRTRTAAVRETRRLESLPEASVAQRCELGVLHARLGRLAAADSVLRALAAAQPGRAEVLLALASLERSRYRFEASDRLLRRAARLEPRGIGVRLAQAEDAASRSDLARAESLYAAVRRDDPSGSAALLGLARLRYAHNEPDSARAMLDELLAREPANAPALLLRASLQREQQKTQGWKDDVAAALAADSLSAGAHAARAVVLREAGKVEEAFQEALAALALDPYEEGAHGYIGNGGSTTSFGRHPTFADDSVPRPLAAALVRAGDALARRDLDGAARAYHALLARHPTLGAAMLGLGAVSYRRGDHLAALAWYEHAARLYPALGIAHYGAATSIKALRDQRNVQVQAAVARFRAMARPAEPERLREVFPDFARADADLQKVILLSVAPVRQYIPLLAAAGATFRLIPFEQRMWEVPRKERTRGTRTFDLRLWDDVKGQGGFHALSGEAWVRDALTGRYNVLSHEFMHQVHGTVLTEAQRDEIKGLFAAAKRERRTLDYYADFNEMEYLAQAYEAAISDFKLSDQKGTSGHTRAEVERLDPGVVRFLATLRARPAGDDNAVVAARQGIAARIGDGDLREAVTMASRALATYGDRAELLVQLGTARRRLGDYAGAIAAHEQAVERFPRDVGGYAALADDYLYGSRDHARALATLGRFVAIDPASAEGWLRLAAFALASGRLDQAETALARADALGQAPNPYASYGTSAVLAARLDVLTGRDSAAERRYTHQAEHVTRGDIEVWTELAAIALRRNDTAAARAALAPARTIDADDPRVLETQARLLARSGERARARELLRRVLAKDSTRLETISLLVAQLREDDPAGASAFVARGLRLLADTSPVRFTYERDRYRSRDVPTAPAIARFHTEAGLLSEAGGDAATALARYREALRVFPLDRRASAALARATSSGSGPSGTSPAP